MDDSHREGSGSTDQGKECREATAAAEQEAGRCREPRSCTDCRTTKTPLWRGGPSGPKSLCNACGIRYRKTRREALGLEEVEKERKERRSGGKAGLIQLLGMGKDASLKRRNLLQLQQRCRWRRLGEEEEAAMLLMALSWGFLYAKA